MSDKEYQRAMADFLRLPEFCQVIRAGQEDALNSYDLTLTERERLYTVARHRGMNVNCILYRAGRLVGITRRLPGTIGLLRPVLREVFDAYLLTCPDAAAEFDQEASCFACFVSNWVDDATDELTVPVENIRSALKHEASGLMGRPIEMVTEGLNIDQQD